MRPPNAARTDANPHSTSGAGRKYAGTHRLLPPGETLARFLPLAPRLGITRLANITGLDVLGIPVFQCVRPNSRTLSVSQGKGVDPESAKASALMECIESWHAEVLPVNARWVQGNHVKPFASFLRTGRKPLSDLMDQPLLAVEGYDWMAAGNMPVPYSLISLDRTERASCGPDMNQSSLGLASGNHYLEAVIHGICEVIERDSLARWQLDDRDPLGTGALLNLSTISSNAVKSLILKIQSAGFAIGILDIRQRFPVPCFQVLLLDVAGHCYRGRVAWGLGCHLSAEVALTRAICEAAQTRLTLISGARDDLSAAVYSAAQDRETFEGLLCTVLNSRQSVDYQKIKSLDSTQIWDDFSSLLSILNRGDVSSVITVDLSCEELNVPCAKVLIPSLIEPGRTAHSSGYRQERA